MESRFPAVWLSLAIFLAATGASGQLLNGSFEEQDSFRPNPYGDLAAYWGRWGNWMNRESAWEPTHGGLSLMGYHHWEIQESSTSGFYQDVTNVAPGSTCVFGIYLFKDPGTDAEFVELRLEQTGGFRAYVSRVYPMNELRTDWQRLWVKGTNESAGVRVLVCVGPKQSSGRNGALKFDDAELTVLPPAGKSVSGD